MCGRFLQTTSGAVLAARFQLATVPDRAPRYNVAPGQPIGAIRCAGDGSWEWAWLRWGLVPAWAPEPKTAYRTINARAETVAEKPAFREAFRRRRCLIPADGFYEWQAVGTGKQPYCIAPADGQPFAFAGLWAVPYFTQVHGMTRAVASNHITAYFGGFADVTSRVAGNGSYTFSGLTVNTGAPHCGSSAVYMRRARSSRLCASSTSTPTFHWLTCVNA